MAGGVVSWRGRGAPARPPPDQTAPGRGEKPLDRGISGRLATKGRPLGDERDGPSAKYPLDGSPPGTKVRWPPEILLSSAGRRCGTGYSRRRGNIPVPRRITARRRRTLLHVAPSSSSRSTPGCSSVCSSPSMDDRVPSNQPISFR